MREAFIDVYQGHLLRCAPAKDSDGTFRARITISSPQGQSSSYELSTLTTGHFSAARPAADFAHKFGTGMVDDFSAKRGTNNGPTGVCRGRPVSSLATNDNFRCRVRPTQALLFANI